jgi:hypothetical protein
LPFTFSDKDLRQTRSQIADGTSSIAFPEYFASTLVPEVGDSKGNENFAN